MPRNATGKAQYPRAKEMLLAATQAEGATGLMRTPLCEEFGIEYPIFAFTPSEHVAAAVSRAGGLGVLGCVRFNETERARETCSRGSTTTPTASRTASTS